MNLLTREQMEFALKVRELIERSLKPKWEQVTEAQYSEFIRSYPRPLDRNVTAICEPPMENFNDFSNGKTWPESMVARAMLCDDGTRKDHEVLDLEYFVSRGLK